MKAINFKIRAKVEVKGHLDYGSLRKGVYLVLAMCVGNAIQFGFLPLRVLSTWRISLNSCYTEANLWRALPLPPPTDWKLVLVPYSVFVLFEKVERKWKDVAAAGLSVKRYPFGYLWQILARHGSKSCLEIPRFILISSTYYFTDSTWTLGPKYSPAVHRM